ncbi:aldo/keto reductase [Natronorarus salvus]|uniref:aldo/keto reductase n=1 Tax=Natronorarus salvus TaxID=3117733 RepID=UPI002F260F2D
MTIDLPRLGFGTYKLEDPEECVESVERAIDVGYRHIDTAQGYENEAFVGDAIENAAVPREELFLATKLSTGNLAYEDVLESAEASRKKLGVETIDLLYVHWPLNTYDPDETLSALSELRERGVIEHVGLSNFRIDQLQVARRELDEPIFAHQVECHPLLPQERLREFAAEDGHHLVAYSPIARGELFSVPEINDVAERHDATAAQVALAWAIEKGIYPIPKARGGHIAENYRALALAEELEPGEIEKIDALEERRRLVDFEEAPWNAA